MEQLQGSVGAVEFLHRLKDAGHGVLLLDYDGTLAPFNEDPASAVPYPGVADGLDKILRQGATRVVIVTGRSVVDGLPQLGTALPVELWGVHGRERRLIDGRYSLEPLTEPALRALLQADEWSDEIEKVGGRCERKPCSLAFHWRGLPDDQVTAIRELIRERWNSLGLCGVLRWLDFDGGIELAAPGSTKSDAVVTLLAETGGQAPMAFLGDDRTDEDAFVAIRDKGLGILVRPHFRPTAADLWLKPPRELLDFLERWHRTLGPPP